MQFGLEALDHAWIVAKPMEHERIDVAADHSPVPLHTPAAEGHSERRASASQVDGRFAAHAEMPMEPPFCLRRRHPDSHSVAFAVARIVGVDGTEPRTASVDEEHGATERAVGD